MSPTAGPGGAALVLVAHGTRTPAGNAVAHALAAQVGRRTGRPVTAAFVELAAPLLADVLAEAEPGTRVVPLLLSGGFHVHHDLPRAVAGASVPLALAPPLGPDVRLARVQRSRLLAAGARPDAPVVLVAAGSTDPRVDDDLAVAAALLAEQWDGPVEVATLSGRGSRLAEVARPGAAVSPYLLAEGHFARRLRAQAVQAGLRVVADVLGADPLVAELAALRAGVARLRAPLSPGRAGRPRECAVAPGSGVRRPDAVGA